MSETIQQEKQTETTDIINASAESVKVLLTKLKRIKVAKDTEVGGLVQDLMELQEKIRQKSMPFDWESERIEAEIKELMPAISKTVKTLDGAANFRKSSVRISYDGKALDACPDEYVKSAILPYRKETTIASSISVEVF